MRFRTDMLFNGSICATQRDRNGDPDFGAPCAFDAVREDLAALALQRAGDVEARSQERLKASEAVAKQKTETQKWRERYEASEHSRLSQKGQLEELRRLQKQCARLKGRAEALEERVKIESQRRRKAEAACDAEALRAVRLQQQLLDRKGENVRLRGQCERLSAQVGELTADPETHARALRRAPRGDDFQDSYRSARAGTIGGRSTKGGHKGKGVDLW